MCAINVPFVVIDPTGNLANWFAVIICFVLGIHSAILDYKR